MYKIQQKNANNLIKIENPTVSDYKKKKKGNPNKKIRFGWLMRKDNKTEWIKVSNPKILLLSET